MNKNNNDNKTLQQAVKIESGTICSTAQLIVEEKEADVSAAGMNSGSMGPTIRVATYNILSDSLCGDFVWSIPDDLDNQMRFARVQAQIQAEMDKGSVICLQVMLRNVTDDAGSKPSIGCAKTIP
jgi:hypothetical protein